MENKGLKKSTMQQLRALVNYMDENPEFAGGCVVFGGSRMSIEEQWAALGRKLNSLGPPVRSIVEWKKTWADLKSRTKKKIAENKRSLSETGGGLYSAHALTELEQIVDRTLFLSKAAAPGGKLFGYKESNENSETSVQSFFVALTSTPPRSNKNVAVITPTRNQQIAQQTQEQSTHLQSQHQKQAMHKPTHHQQQTKQPPLCTKSQQLHNQVDDFVDELPSCSSAKKKKDK